MAQINVERSTVVDVSQPSLRWGAIFAGWLVAVGMAFLMYVGGLAMGFTAFDPNDAEAAAKGFAIGTAAWLVLTWVVSLLIGGMFASWFDGRNDPTTGVMHGITVWGLSIAASGLLLALGMGGTIGGGATLAAAVGAGASSASQTAAATPGGQDNATVLLQATLSQRVSATTSNAATAAPMQGMQSTPAMSGAQDMQSMHGNMMAMHSQHAARRLDRRTAAAVTAALLADHPDTAKALLAANTNMSTSDIDATIQSLSAQVHQTQNQLKAAADTAANYAAMAMWILLLSLVLSLLAAALGGWLGASHVHRVYHLRRYTRDAALD